MPAFNNPTVTAPTASFNPVSQDTPPVLHTGMISSQRWRGQRQSQSLTTLVEAVLADITTLKQRVIEPYCTDSPLLLQGITVPGIYSLGNADPRLNIYVQGINQLLPIVQALNTIQIQSLRAQIAFKLNTLR